MAHTIELEQVTKRYDLGQRAQAYGTLRDAIGGAIGQRPRRKRRPADEVWALRDVDLTVDEGEVVGVVGRNGAGKSTLLKVLSRITAPTTGVSRTRGRVGALLEIGTGFHPELTGRENVYLNGTVLGMSRRDVERRFDEIVAFADIERFLDTPVKRYSSGMFLRLAFAVAAHIEPDILIVDEVLAVGDVAFQERCLGRMSEFGSEGRTVVFVSHDLGAISQLCERVVWFERGAVAADGPPPDVLDRYLTTVAQDSTNVVFTPQRDQRVQLRSASIRAESRPGDLVRRDEPVTIRLSFVTSERIPGLDVGIRLTSRNGTVVLDENLSDVQPIGRLDEAERYEASLTVPAVLPSGEYVASVWIAAWVGSTVYEVFLDREILRLRLWPTPDERPESIERRRAVQPPVTWNVRTIGHSES